jgi:hypothetical protein
MVGIDWPGRVRWFGRSAAALFGRGDLRKRYPDLAPDRTVRPINRQAAAESKERQIRLPDPKSLRLSDGTV